jgi:hypothetical protein
MTKYAFLKLTVSELCVKILGDYTYGNSEWKMTYHHGYDSEQLRSYQHGNLRNLVVTNTSVTKKVILNSCM